MLCNMSKKPQIKDQRLQLVVDREFIAAIDAWRRRQDPIPSRSEAIRRMVLAGVGMVPTGHKTHDESREP